MRVEPILVPVVRLCASNLGATIKKWHETGKGDLGTVADCLVETIDRFSGVADGQKKDVWTSSEIANVVRQFYTDLAEPERFMADLFLLKPILLGGEANSISRSEFGDLKSLIMQMRGDLSELSQFHDVLYSLPRRVSLEQSILQARRAGDILQSLASRLSARVQTTLSSASSFDRERGSVRVSDLFRLLVRLGMHSQFVESRRSIAELLKGILVGGNDHDIKRTEWSELIQSASSTFSLANQLFALFGSAEPLFGSIDKLKPFEMHFSDVENVLLRIVDRLRACVQVQPDRQIRLSKFQSLLGLLADKGIIDFGVPIDLVNQYLEVVLSKWLYGASRPDFISHGRALNEGHIQKISSAVDDFIFAQKILLNLKSRNTTSQSAISAEMESLLKSARERQLLLLQLQDLLGQGRILSLDGRGRYHVARGDSIYTTRDLTRVNVARAIGGLLLTGYAKEANRGIWPVGLEEGEVQQLYLDFRNLGIQLNLVDSRVLNSGERSFNEANLFTSVANGDKYVSLHEAVEWMYFVLSGWRVAKDFFAKAATAASQRTDCDLPEDMHFVRPKLNIRCFNDFLAKQMSIEFDYLPDLQIDFQKYSDRKKEKFFKTVEATYRNRGADLQPIDESEIRGMVPVMGYSESLFQRFDRNHDDQLDHEEVWTALPLLTQLLKKEGASYDWQVRSVYAYLMDKGTKPGWLQVPLWQVKRFFVGQTADRMKIVKIMAAFAESNRKRKLDKLQSVLDQFHPEVVREKLRSSDPSFVQELQGVLGCQESVTRFFTALVRTESTQLIHEKPGRFPWSSMQVDLDHFLARIRALVDGSADLESSCLLL